MALPPHLFNKYLDRFNELITEGEEISENELNFLSNNFNRLGEWKVKCITLLDQVVPQNSAHRNLIEDLKKPEEPNKVNWIYQAVIQNCLSSLKGIKSDFQSGFLEDLTLAIEAEIAADYMGQAEQLLAEGQPGQYDHVPAAVLSGAVLEKALRTLCSKQSPPISTLDSKGKPLTLNPLIENLKKAGFFNETTAKQLRAWADIRNDAAHGDFAKFNRSDVQLMIQGINNFLARYN